MAAKFMGHIPYGYNVSKAIVNHPEHLAFYEVVDIKIIQHNSTYWWFLTLLY